ncbi:PorP/SprF family type IX secretion system membrane protein [Croceimicrobium hydrocarbonivorans]|uniref:Type IX secretion system membrane protein PorP/SprF n=1 Tax=Croceimicrobium hydrocarbonivorans TaxID=2761580 RepID=A0A7H0VI46_9FLAO|nr:type IX secretion system membrane protein PorP/SprF [Croceimicrobium hydrocarbonivorans]QNR25394.1 type IX secretion system membrane protein PorP/SprF [Croceimicrobium hydrocarbonivorans]
MKKFYLIMVLAFPLFALAQQDVQFSQYMFNRVYYNPGVAGSGGAICINGLHRSQWVGFEGAPITQNININAPFKKLHGGIGLSIVNDQIGFFNNISARLMYGYQIDLSTGTLGIGLGASFLNNQIASTGWIPSDGVNGALDPGVYGLNETGFQVDGIFGIYYESQNIWGGISSTRVIESSTDVGSFNGLSSTFIRNARHYYLMGGYNWAVPASNWELRPSMLLKLTSGSTTFDINAMGVYNNKFWGGVTYRLQDAVAVMIGWQATPGFKLGYSYDVATSALSTRGGGSHEIMASYCFKIVIPPPTTGSHKNPRFL